jgi:hypothetical protein
MDGPQVHPTALLLHFLSGGSVWTYPAWGLVLPSLLPQFPMHPMHPAVRADMRVPAEYALHRDSSLVWSESCRKISCTDIGQVLADKECEGASDVFVFPGKYRVPWLRTMAN